jgi:YVTN family beta-propeller protein
MSRWICFALLCVLAAGSASAEVQTNYTLFESGPVRPLALSPDRTLLFACNIPDGRLEIFSVSSTGIAHVGSVPVGLEPVAVAARSNDEVWVVNHLSDSISIVDVPSRRVTRTLLVGDEPRDIVFGGTAKNRAFITAAHRGQNRPGDPQLLAGGVPRSDVWVFDANDLDGTPSAPLAGKPLTILSLFGDTPRALAVTPDGATVYAAVFHSGNQTTILPAGVLPNVDLGDPNDPNSPTGALAEPNEIGGLLPRPAAGVMLKYQSGTTWVDVNGVTHTNNVPFLLPDHDVFMINAELTPPARTSYFDHVGTILFNMVVNPSTGVVYVSNTDANNMDRFEGFGPVNLRGELEKARISILSGTSTVSTRHLNKHIDYAPDVAPLAVNQASLGIPTDMAIDHLGRTLYVAAFGSQEIGIVDTAALALPPSDPNSFTPNAANHIPLSAGGPGGIVLDESHGRLYVYTRFDDGISTVDPAAKLEVAHLTLHNPEGSPITLGRKFLYDTHLTSSNGEASCAVCHVFGDFDSLAWDLGSPSPDGAVLGNYNPFVKITGTSLAIVGPVLKLFLPSIVPGNVDFHPMKGPMTTQTLRGMEHGGPMHWRGDRSGGGFYNRGNNFDGDPNALDENQAFLKFNVAFKGLLGRAGPLSDTDMQAFANFILRVQLPPNPIRNLDGTLTAVQAAGATFFHDPNNPNATSDTLKDCNGCHTLDPSKGFFGTGGLSTFEGLPQHFKVPHLRNAYQKVGMFGIPGVSTLPGHGISTDEQIRGFGYLNDGSIDTVVTFLNGAVFAFPTDPNDSTSPFFGNPGSVMRTNVANFVMAFPSDIAPVVGQQVTLTTANASDPNTIGRINLLVARAGISYPDVDPPAHNECDLIVKTTVGGVTRGWWLSGVNTFTPDSSTDPVLSDAGLRAQVGPGEELTYTCVPPLSGERMGIDRGGVGDSSQPDGIRDANQCGDVTGDGIAAKADVVAERALLAAASTPVAPGKCNVAGANGSGAGTCDILDVTKLRRVLAGVALPSSLSAGCNG